MALRLVTMALTTFSIDLQLLYLVDRNLREFDSGCWLVHDN